MTGRETREGGGRGGGFFCCKICKFKYNPGVPLTYFTDGGGPRDFFRSEILAKRDFFGGLWRTWGFFWVAKKTRDFLGIALFISSNQK